MESANSPQDAGVLEGEEGGEGGDRQGEEGGAYEDHDARLRIKVEQGDVLVINTKAWYHQTDIEVQRCEDGLSCSFARDWYM